MKRALLSAAVAVVLSAGQVTATPQDEWVQQVRRQLQSAGQRFEERGYTMTHRIYTGSLDDDESEMVQVDLAVGKEYQIMGACDNDCSDLDLVLFDGAGNEIDSDLLEDDVPIVTVEVTRSGNFRLRVQMAACSREPCRYGIGVFGR